MRAALRQLIFAQTDAFTDLMELNKITFDKKSTETIHENYGGKGIGISKGNENKKEILNSNHIINNNITYCLIMNNLHFEMNGEGEEKKKCRLNFIDAFRSFCIIDIVQIRLFLRDCVFV